jgi:hypothetical protein
MRQQAAVTVVVLVISAGALWAGQEDAPKVVGLALTGDEAVEFLNTAEVSSKPEDFDDVAITSPRRLELTKGDLTLRVIFKDENTLHRGTFRFGDGREVPMVRDSYLHEIAAYELDRLLGLGIVAPCVERKLFRRKGSLCLWVEDSITEAERKKRDLEPPDIRAWNEQIDTARLFQQLISDQDFSNIRNLVVDSSFKVYKIDSSLAFYPDSRLIDQLDPPVYPPGFLAALEALDRDTLDERLEPWLVKAEIKSLWERREKILERARTRIAEHGEEKMLY